MQLHVKHALQTSSQLEHRQHVIRVLPSNQIVRHVLQVQHAQLATPDSLLVALVVRVLLVILLYHLALNVVVMELHVPNALQTCSQMQAVILV